MKCQKEKSGISPAKSAKGNIAKAIKKPRRKKAYVLYAEDSKFRIIN